MDEQSKLHDVARLTAQLSDGQLTDVEMERLDALLLDDPQAQALYHQCVSLHVALEWTYGVAPSASDHCKVTSGSPISGTGEAQRSASVMRLFRSALRGRSSPLAAALAWMIVLLSSCALMAAIFVVALTVQGMQSHGDVHAAAAQDKTRGEKHDSAVVALPQLPPSPPSVASPVARLARMVDVRWGKGAEPALVGEDLMVGQQLHLESGLAQFVCSRGVELLVQGPAMLTFTSDRSVFLTEGRATVRLTSPEGRGFSIQTPQSAVVDEGTEFGVDVAPGGDQSIHVFQGKVQFSAKSKDGKQTVQRQLTANQGARVRAETQAVSLVAGGGEGFAHSLDRLEHDPHTVAYWRFEDQPIGALAPDSGSGRNPVRGTLDCSGNGNDLFAWNVATAPRFSADVPAESVAHMGMPNHGSLDNSALPSIGSRDLYTKSLFSHAAPIDLQKISPREWTIEASVKPAALRHTMQVFVGRDGTAPFSEKRSLPQLALAIDAAGRFAIYFVDADGRPWWAVAERLRVQPGDWYDVAATSDGRRLRLYVDANDGRGYQLQATTALAAGGNTALGIGDAGAEWSIGRGKDADASPANWFQGWIDEVRISDVARVPSDFLFAAPPGQKEQPATARRQ